MRNAMTVAAALVLAGCYGAAPANQVADVTTINTDQLANGTGAVPANRTEAETGRPVLAPVLTLSGDGLTLVDSVGGTTRAIAFSGTKAATIAAVAALRGAPTDSGTNPECGAGPMTFATFAGGLTLSFQQDRFIGWGMGDKGDPTILTTKGIGIGSTRSALDAAYLVTVEQTSLGTEFDARGLYGLLDGTAPTAKITNLWAGTTCIFR